MNQLSYTCHWKQKFDVKVDKLKVKVNLIQHKIYLTIFSKLMNYIFKCDMHHCGHPNIDDGSHPHPAPEYDIYLVNTTQTQVYTNILSNKIII